MLLVKTYLATSPIHGLGLFADDLILKGRRIWEFDDEVDVVITPDIVVKLPNYAFHQVMKYSYRDMEDGDYILCSDDARHMNHSDTPNVLNEDGMIDIAACDILPGTELTCDYRVFDADWKRKLGCP